MRIECRFLNRAGNAGGRRRGIERQLVINRQEVVFPRGISETALPVETDLAYFMSKDVRNTGRPQLYISSAGDCEQPDLDAGGLASSRPVVFAISRHE